METPSGGENHAVSPLEKEDQIEGPWLVLISENRLVSLQRMLRLRLQNHEFFWNTEGEIRNGVTS